MAKIQYAFIALLLGAMLVLQGLGEYRERSKPPTTWEYMIASVADLKFGEEMKLAGENRWELVFARRASNSRDEMMYECIFRRPALVP